jgi:hypothetical protein
MKECTNKGKASTSKSIFSKNVNIVALKVMRLTIVYPLQPKFHLSKSTNNKDGKGK